MTFQPKEILTKTQPDISIPVVETSKYEAPKLNSPRRKVSAQEAQQVINKYVNQGSPTAVPETNNEIKQSKLEIQKVIIPQKQKFQKSNDLGNSDISKNPDASHSITEKKLETNDPLETYRSQDDQIPLKSDFFSRRFKFKFSNE